MPELADSLLTKERGLKREMKKAGSLSQRKTAELKRIRKSISDNFSDRKVARQLALFGNDRDPRKSRSRLGRDSKGRLVETREQKGLEKLNFDKKAAKAKRASVTKKNKAAKARKAKTKARKAAAAPAKRTRKKK